ncbi:hypothetical protein [Agriterribacter sp.]|uniref:hypothetical protein n=1 Tax=Agriterribacter sp. TaxID=2821509 RepID=UPI002CB361C3|nr:hypothetical protein [Agriterribacter sp.]HTN09096.1 hypothetical protein [Agriterribacter sp.]
MFQKPRGNYKKVVSDRIAAKFDNEVLWLGLSYSAHPVSCAAPLEVLKIHEDENMIANKKTAGIKPAVKKQYLFLFADNDLL